VKTRIQKKITELSQESESYLKDNQLISYYNTLGRLSYVIKRYIKCVDSEEQKNKKGNK